MPKHSNTKIIQLLSEGNKDEATKLQTENFIDFMKKIYKNPDWVEHSKNSAHKTKKCANCFITQLTQK